MILRVSRWASTDLVWNNVMLIMKCLRKLLPTFVIISMLPKWAVSNKHRTRFILHFLNPFHAPHYSHMIFGHILSKAEGIVGGDDGSVAFPHPRGWSASPMRLGRVVARGGLCQLFSIVRAISFLCPSSDIHTHTRTRQLSLKSWILKYKSE